MDYIEVTAAIIKKDDKFLIAKRKKGSHLENKWEFPGGKIELNETAEDCLKRELTEEFGVETEIEDFFEMNEFNYGDKKIRLLCYKVKYISGQFQLNAHDEIKWVSIDEFNKYDFAEADIPIIKKLIREIY